jgi:hypothetical protein
LSVKNHILAILTHKNDPMFYTFKIVRTLIVTLFYFGISQTGISQKQANIWYFGNGGGLDFNNQCNPLVLTDGAIQGYEGCATISDKNTGQILFYTNSAQIWNRVHQIMPNGNLIPNGNTITQVTIIQKPGSDSLYYVITSEIQGFSGQGYRFHMVDMSLNGGMGGILYKDSLLYSSPVTEKMIAVPHANGTDAWMIGHAYNSNQFLAFHISATGINRSPVISSVGKIHFDPSSADAVGEIKATPNATKIAVVTLVSPHIELFDFDNNSGIISNPILIPERGAYNSNGNASGLYGLSFSADNSKLYASQWLAPSAGISAKIIQYDISSNDSALIQQSRVNVFTSTTKNLYSLKLAPNRKIYVGQNQSNGYLGVINAPDSSGLLCNYVDNGLYLNGKNSGWGLNNLMEYTDLCEVMSQSEKTKEINSYTLSPNPFNTETLFTTTYPLHNAKLTIFNTLGQIVFVKEKIAEQSFQIQSVGLPTGIHFAQITQENQILFSFRLLVQN